MRTLSLEHSELQRAEILMRREAFERAGSQARSLGVPRDANPFVRSNAEDAERNRLSELAEHWWRGWDMGRADRRPGPERGRR